MIFDLEVVDEAVEGEAERGQDQQSQAHKRQYLRNQSELGDFKKQVEKNHSCKEGGNIVADVC